MRASEWLNRFTEQNLFERAVEFNSNESLRVEIDAKREAVASTSLTRLRYEIAYASVQVLRLNLPGPLQALFDASNGHDLEGLSYYEKGLLHLNLGIYHSNARRFKEGTQHFERAIANFQHAGCRIEEFRVYANSYMRAFREGDTKKAEHYLAKAKKLEPVVKNSLYLSYFYHCQAIANEQDNPTLAEKLSIKARSYENNADYQRLHKKTIFDSRPNHMLWRYRIGVLLVGAIIATFLPVPAMLAWMRVALRSVIATAAMMLMNKVLEKLGYPTGVEDSKVAQNGVTFAVVNFALTGLVAHLTPGGQLVRFGASLAAQAAAEPISKKVTAKP